MDLEPEGLGSSLGPAFNLSECSEVHRARGRAGGEHPAACPLCKEESGRTRSTGACEYRLEPGRETCAVIMSETSLLQVSDSWCVPACEVPTVLLARPGGRSGVLRQAGIDISGWSHQCYLLSPRQVTTKFSSLVRATGAPVMCAIDHSPLPEHLSFRRPQHLTLSSCPLSLSLAVPSLQSPFL